MAFFLGSLAYLFHQYFRVFPIEGSTSFQYALSAAMPYVISESSKYQTIVVSNEQNLSQSYMFYLYWSKFDPVAYLAVGGTKSGGFAEFHKIGKYNFRPIHWSSEHPAHGSLFVGNIDDFPSDLGYQKIFKSLDVAPTIEIIGY